MSDAPVSDAPTEAEQTETVVTDPVRQPLLDVLTAELDDALLGSDIAKDDIVVRVAASAWRRTAELCRDRLSMEYFCFLSGIDWKVAPELSGEKTYEPAGAPIATDDGAEDGTDDGTGDGSEGGSDEQPADGLVTGRAGGDTRFQVFARFYSVTKHVGITVKADLDETAPSVESITSVYRGADWHERETWEMYGFDFVGHPALRHMYLPGEFEGYPLRKDFPLLAREVKPWPGLVDVEPLPGEAEDGNAVPAEGGE